jgi:sulfonate dioxygenase
VIPGKYKEPRRGIRMTVFGERLYFDSKSESREQREERLETARVESARPGGPIHLNGNAVNGKVDLN